MSNHRSDCPYCHNSVLSRDIGSHIFRFHEAEIFDTKNTFGVSNRRNKLYSDKYFNKPLLLTIGNNQYFVCLADRSFIKNETNALNHFKGKADKHKEGLLKLREKYPLDSTDSPTATSTEPLLTEDVKKLIHEDLARIISSLRSYQKKYPDDDCNDTSFSKKSLRALSKIGLFVDDGSLKGLCPVLFDEPESEKSSVVEEESLLPLVTEKPMTKEEMIKATFTEKDIDNLSKSLITGETQVIPELQQIKQAIQSEPIKRKPKQVAFSTVVSEEPKPTVKPVDVEVFKPMSKWEMLVSATPEMKTNAERLSHARYIGFPESEIPSEILHPQTAARPITVPPPTAPPPPDMPKIIYSTKAKRVPKAVDSH